MKGGLAAISMLLITLTTMAQGVGVGTDAPHASALIEVKATGDRGVMLPSLSQADINSIASPAEGLVAYNTTSSALSFFDGTQWIALSTLPYGTIICWSGTVGSIPAGWALCDGQWYDRSGKPVSSGGVQTPDLTGRFVVGYSPDDSRFDEPFVDKGGAATVSLSVSEMPGHTHSVNSTHQHPVSHSGGNHTHSISFTTIRYSPVSAFTETTGNDTYRFNKITRTLSTDPVSTTIDFAGSKTGVTIGNSGGGQAHENRPAYYVLAFIMKL